MRRATRLAAVLVWVVGAGVLLGPSAAQVAVGPFDPLRFAQLKGFGAYRASSNNPDLDSNDDSKRPIPGETIVLADLTGPGIVTHIWLTVAANEYGWPRLLRLRVYYDGSSTPSVDCPVGDFFAVGHGFERPVSSLIIRDSSSGRSRNSYWPMPFRKSCRITITNEGRRRVSNLYYHVDWQKMAAFPPNTAYFHALYRQELPAVARKPYEILSVKGRGHYVGTVLNVIQAQSGWFGEGDDFFYVDGERKARIEGTGTEDYFNDAWSLRVADGPYTGVPVAEGTGLGSRMTAYRWHIVDPIPFRRSLTFNIEHKGWTYNTDGSVRSAFEERPDLFSSVAFWYQIGIAAGLPEPPYGARRLPHGNARQIEVEDLLPEVKTEAGTASIQREVFWSKDLLFFKAKGPGSTIDVPLDVAEDGYYEIVAQVAHRPDYGDYNVLLDGKSPSAARNLEPEPGANEGRPVAIHAYFHETYVAEDHLVGWVKLTRGRHRLSFVCTGKNADSRDYNIGIDTVILSKVAGSVALVSLETASRADALRHLGTRVATPASISRLVEGLDDRQDELREAAAWSLGQMGRGSAPAIRELTTALTDTDPVVRGLAAVALRDVGTVGGATLEALISRLADEDVNVRLMAADAIGRQGARAVRAVDPLIEAAKRKDEHVHAQRSFATALGQIGVDAARALPVLHELARIPRVEWAANEAIARITKQGRTTPVGR